MKGYMKMANALEEAVRVPYGHDFRETRYALIDIIPEGAKVLDFGCGNGTLGGVGDCRFKGKLLHIDGLDIDPENPVAKYHDMGEITGHYDVIVASHVIEHCQPDEVRKLLDWFHEHCDTLMVVLPNAGDNIYVNFWNDSTHIRPYNIAEFLYWNNQAGFKVRKVIRSRLPIVRWYAQIFRLITSQLAQTSPFCDYTVISDRKA